MIIFSTENAAKGLVFGFTDYVAITVVARTAELIEQAANPT